MTRTLVTGAAGFTGGYVGRLLAENDHEVHGLVHELSVTAIDGYAHVHSADLRQLEEVRRTVLDIQPDHIVHLAAVAFVGHSDVDSMYDVNVVGTRHLLEALTLLDRAPSSVLLASSANIYGNAPTELLDENVPAAPANDYGVSKLAMEFVASIYKSRLPLIVVRPFNYTGRGQASNYIIPKIVEHARSGARVLELGNLEVARDFSDVRTIAACYARLLGTTSAVSGTFNVCSGIAHSLREIVDTVAELSGRSFEVRVNPAFVRDNEVRRLRGSPERLERAIGPLHPIPLRETLRWMLDE